MAMARVSRFQKSRFGHTTPTYRCRVCKRLTRNTGDEGGVTLCLHCWELAGIENTISDNGLELAREWGYVETATRLLKELRAKGIDVDTVWASLVAELTPKEAV